MSNKIESFPIDAVFTWVDGNAPAWIEARRRRWEELTAQSRQNSIFGADALAPARFRDNGELRYALRSLALYAPWIRTVHIITAGQCPEWLDTTQVNLVDHTQIFPDIRLLPVFSTRPIELCVHRIPGLAEQFLYFNDDFMLGRTVEPKDFFLPTGEPIIWAVQHSARTLQKRAQEKKASHAVAVNKSCTLIREHFGMDSLYRMRHFPKAMTITTAQGVWETFPDAVQNTLASPFRSLNDITMTMLYPLYLLATSQGKLRKINGIRQWLDMFCGGVRHIGTSLGDHNWKRKLSAITRLCPKTFCLNDSTDAKDEDRLLFQNWLTTRFPQPCRFEREGK